MFRGRWVAKKHWRQHVCQPPRVRRLLKSGSLWRCRCDRLYRLSMWEWVRAREDGSFR